MAQLLLGSATWSVWTFVRTNLQTMLAIAAWEKGTSWRAQGWAGENATATTGPCTPHESQRVRHPASRRAKKRTSLESHKQATVSAIVEERKSPKKDAVLPLLRN